MTTEQYIIVFLILLLFARDLLAVFIKKWFGVDIKNGNGNGNGKPCAEEIERQNKRIEELESHAKVANEEMGEVKVQLVRISTKLDIIMNHLNL